MNYTKGPIIGRGSSATVHLATTATGDLFAVKSTTLSTSSSFQKEQQLLSKLTSPHLIKYIGFDNSIEPDNYTPMYNLYMEYAPNGSITDVIENQGGRLDECLIKSYTRQILLGLDYLHCNNIVHCDIKCANMLVCDDAVKIGDLGCAKILVDDYNYENTSSVFSGTPVFMAPEVARGESQGFAADVWAVGCAVIEMATGCNPWPELKDPVSGLYKIGYSGDEPVVPVGLSEEAKDFLKNCLGRKVEERLTVKQLLKHPFVDLDSCCKKVENLGKRSPSSVMDQGFWDSFEVTESRDRTDVSGESPVDRIKKLVEATETRLVSCWVDEEDWITVRSNHVDENLNVAHEDLCMDGVMVDDDSESTRSEGESFAELYVEEGFSSLDGMILECHVAETSCVSVVNPRFLVFKNISNDNCSLVDSNINIAVFTLRIINRRSVGNQ